ncbi:DUF3892 domain-containing protein [Pseudomonas cichorii]|uniref:DUF3892 domain-containing protein n=1 Tax=Pseudomonas cichorii TaxID=36746 RepID=UPI001C8AD840|nr:DUF3892 domain-containing protein [Pseudomonas cichorii]MBX8575632.1 DUF3892 domain-containing protein [Pseudomonas cichorii]
MVDFCITEVRYQKDGKHIDYVKVREELGNDKVGSPRFVGRNFIVDLIRLKKTTFQTRTQDKSGGWKKGAAVIIYNNKFLTTEGNNTEKDNLGELPEFK